MNNETLKCCICGTAIEEMSPEPLPPGTVGVYVVCRNCAAQPHIKRGIEKLITHEKKRLVD
jgi:hypothetical protein